jgi:hypothetical protein
MRNQAFKNGFCRRRIIQTDSNKEENIVISVARRSSLAASSSFHNDRPTSTSRRGSTHCAFGVRGRELDRRGALLIWPNARQQIVLLLLGQAPSILPA